MPRESDISPVPPGWQYNPASWSQRLPIVGLAILGGAIATYLALYQYDVTGGAWDPLFSAPKTDGKNGTEAILTSSLSFPFQAMGLGLPFRISDASLGAFAYLLDALTGVIGGTRRWRDMPWIVIIFAIMVGPLGLVSLGLVIAQPVVEQNWCTLCLCSAAISVTMIPPAMDEALASLQYVKRAYDDPNRSFWKAFWGIEKDGSVNFW